MSINRARSETAGIVNLLLGAATPPPDVVVRGRTGGVEQGAGMRKMDLLASERRKGDLKRRTLIGGDAAPGVLAVTFTARYLFAFK